MLQWQEGAYQLTLLPAEESAPVVWLHGDAGQAQELFDGRCTLVSVSGVDWNRDLSPWPAPKAFRQGEDFAGGAAAYLRTLTEQLLPAAEAKLPWPVTQRGIVGYSLAGLFAVHALYMTDCFDFAGSVSGSLWYDDWLDYALTHPLRPALPRIYLSLGDREHKTRNARMARVRDCTEAVAGHWEAQGITVRLEWNPGGHFDGPQERVRRALAWLGEPALPV